MIGPSSLGMRKTTRIPALGDDEGRDDQRVERGGEEFSPEFDSTFQQIRELMQDLGRSPRGIRRSEHADDQIVERLAVVHGRLVKCVSSLHSFDHEVENGQGRSAGGLFSDGAKCLHQWKACFQSRGKFTDQSRHVALAHRGASTRGLGGDALARWLGLGIGRALAGYFQPRGRLPALHQLANGLASAAGRERAAVALPAGIRTLIAVGGHLVRCSLRRHPGWREGLPRLW